MQPLLFTIFGLGLVGLVSLIRASYNAPEAVEDGNGFHLLLQADRDRYAFASSSVLLGKAEVLFFQVSSPW